MIFSPITRDTRRAAIKTGTPPVRLSVKLIPTGTINEIGVDGFQFLNIFSRLHVSINFSYYLGSIIKGLKVDFSALPGLHMGYSNFDSLVIMRICMFRHKKNHYLNLFE